MNWLIIYKKNIIFIIFTVGITALVISYIMSYKWFNESLNFHPVTAFMLMFFSVTAADIFMILGRQSKKQSRYAYYLLSVLFIIFSMFCSVAGQLTGLSGESGNNSELIEISEQINKKELALEECLKRLETAEKVQLYIERTNRDQYRNDITELKNRRKELEKNKSDNNVFSFLTNMKKSPAEWLKLFFILIPAILVDITHPICFTAVIFNNLRDTDHIREVKKMVKTKKPAVVKKPVDTAPDWNIEPKKEIAKSPVKRKKCKPDDKMQMNLFAIV